MNKKYQILVVLSLSLLFLTGCQSIGNFFKTTQEQFLGLSGTLRTFDENSQVIDKISGKSISIESDDRFDITDENGDVSKESSVLDITVGGSQVIHVGSTLIFAENGLTDYMEKYSDKVDISTENRSLPFVNRFFNQIKNDISGESKLILIRSQTGTPLATYFGKRVSTSAPDGIPNTTYLLVDGKRLIIYRADFTIYDTDLLDS
ncbi:MAG: DUF5052 family protein [Streptococcus orisratti]|uniref:DUF5052 family protein n=1 Tax=Streptococcus orisratti TaxID=114652 RepID=UPI0023579EBB|nr:DUF5052 family protein [Streptococcus orisratti]MCI7676583.1 DUF5052 family protein [Streptococcus orisratti]